MTTTDERRADGIQRVPVEALVEVCGAGGGSAPFEAESADMSGRGIRLRTAYLPEMGSPVVCRFENAGREVIAEGVVAWQKKATRGGEFGVRFTALDARSADTLREICGIEEAGATAQAAVVDALDQRPRPNVAAGTKVKLHIEGLGSPMRARIDEGKGSHISVGSSLEFLRIGRRLEMESVEDGSRREARIDGLDVTIDPSSGVPRLLVLLKTNGDEDTPQPSVVDAPQRATSSVKRAAEHREQPSEPSRNPSPSGDSDEPTEEQIDAMVGRVRRMASATRRTLSQVGTRIGSRLGPGMGSALRAVRQLSQRKPEPARRRTTAPPTANGTQPDRKLRPQSRAAAEAGEAPSTSLRPDTLRLRRVAGGVVVMGLLATVIAVAARSPESVKSAKGASDPSNADRVALGTPGSLEAPSVGQILPAASAVPGSSPVANVPLFGPTTMATLERAPIASADPLAVVAAREQAPAKASAATLSSGVEASRLSEDSSATAAEVSEEPATKPEDVAPFGHGRMKEPTLYRLKLDAPGEALKGTSSNKGFTVTVPGRKLLESPSGFVKRDPRFEKVTASGTSDGVKLTWQFKDEAPPFRVRLRKSSIEILISEAGETEKSSGKSSKSENKSSKPERRSGKSN
jgi:hypothetical protein